MKNLVLVLVVLLAVAGAAAGAWFLFVKSDMPDASVRHPGPPATLLVQTDPNGAAVKLDGLPYGVTPVAISPVAPGDHALEVTAVDGKVKKQVVTIKAGERQSVTVQISP